MKKNIHIAVVGAGGFANFAVTEFVKIPTVRLAGVYDENIENARRLKLTDPSAKIYDTLNELYSDPAVDLVYIATPPYLHYEQSKMALLSGKHVVFEKPAAIKLAHAKELKALAEERQLLFVVNLMQRYNPFYEAINELIQQNVLGNFLHGFFENYASDEFLTEHHWFWDEEKSGGIFIEHGVHFFDMFSGWLGEGKVIASQKLQRLPLPNVWDKAQAIVLYANGLVNFYHGFDQPKKMDRQEMRLLFERGEVTLYEWVPTRVKMTALCSESELKTLQLIFPGAAIEIVEHFQTPMVSRGRFKEISYQYKLKLDTGDALQKEKLYQDLVASMFKDQLAWINDRAHVRKINAGNAVSSLEMAETAEQLANKIYE
jgi:predicted dehydrogenase